MIGIFNKIFGEPERATENSNPKKDGVLGQLDLCDWWHESFTEEEKQFILERYKPFDGWDKGESVLTHGNISISNPRIFLSSTALWFNDAEGFSIALKFMDKAQEYSVSAMDILDYHFDCHERIKFYYRWRDKHEGALEAAIGACKEQIEISYETAPVCLKKFGAFPHHTGYEQLAIIYEKQGRFEEAIELCEQGMAQGWSNEFDKRLVRLKKKIK